MCERLTPLHAVRLLLRLFTADYRLLGRGSGLFGGRGRYVRHIFKHKTIPVPSENELALAPCRAGFTLFFVRIHWVGLDQLSVLNHQAHVAAQAVVNIMTLECVLVRRNRHIDEFPIPQLYYAEEIHTAAP